MTPPVAEVAFTHRGGGPRVALDERTGLPVGIAAGEGHSLARTAFSIELESGGDEVPGPMSGLVYENTTRHQAAGLVPGSLEHVTQGPEEQYSMELEAGEWRLRLRIVLRDEHPRVAFHVAATPVGPDAGILRDVHVNVRVGDEDLDGWLVEAPGNALRSGVRADEVREPIAVWTAGDQLGSPGLAAFHRPGDDTTLVAWPLSRSESSAMEVVPDEDGIRLHVQTKLAGVVEPGEWIEHGPLYVDVVDRPWEQVRGELSGWYRQLGISTPDDKPEWTAAVNIFEVMVGSAPFRGGPDLSPYPAMADLTADLDRIAALGIDCVQLMPRHPYPSYNVHEPGDVALTYGEPDELRALIDGCHLRGMRLIFDILLHGVVDHASLKRAIEIVEQSPYADVLDDPCSDPYTLDSVYISWGRHILEFAPAWLAGSPEHHTLLDEHPEWFMRDSGGRVVGVYTNALDIANEAWQDHFIDSCVQMVMDLGIDGFRLDAPLYNQFANWSETTRRHASYSNLGSMRLLRKLRRRLHAVAPEVLLYSEPSGSLLRESLDLTYSYEENWLIPSLYPEPEWEDRDWRRVRNGVELAAWFRDFDAAVPAGRVAAHGLDNHDTMWWRLEGGHWRRQQIGLAATKALLAVYALRGGGYMTFVGGEREIEAELRLVHALRRHLPEIRTGAVDYDAVSVGDEAIYGVLRHTGDRATLVLVNTSDRVVETTCSARLPVAVDPVDCERVFDAWAGEWLPVGTADDGRLLFEHAFGPLEARVLVLGPIPANVHPPQTKPAT